MHNKCYRNVINKLKQTKEKHIWSDVFFRLIFVAAEIGISQRLSRCDICSRMHKYRSGEKSVQIHIEHVQ